jgi:CRISPR/Cas system CMR-associated protein Cmr5 small subunit
LISREIFIYRGEENDDSKKEICTVYGMLKQKYVKIIRNIGLLVTVTCYQYGTWIITRGPKNIEQLT